MPTKPTAKFPTARAIIAGIVTPEGFDRLEETVPKDGWSLAHKRLSLSSPEVRIWIEFGADSRRHEAWLFASGHVEFKSPSGWRTFDRYGVEDSFYIDGPKSSMRAADPAEQANEAIARYLNEKIPEALARAARSERVPGIPFELTPETRDKIAAKLQRGEPYSFMPSGFGTGYTLSAKRSRWSKAAERATARYFGCEALYVETFDAD